MDSTESSVDEQGELGADPAARVPTAARTLRSPIDMDVLPGLLGYHLRMAQLALQRSFARTVGATEVGNGLFGLLVLTGANPGIAQIQVATHLDIDKASVVSLVDQLEQSGWLVRRRALDDRRRYGLFLTGEGLRQLRQLKAQMQVREQALEQLYTPEERRQLIGLLQRMRP